MKSLFYFFVIASVVVLIGIFFWAPSQKFPVTEDQKQALHTLSFQLYLKSNYSFSTDTDLDGLSDAMEIIYGSDPLRNDTDGDGFLDGQEVTAGYDPLAPGKARLTDRKNPSLTVQYINWLANSQEKGYANIDLTPAHIEAFLRAKGLFAFLLPPVLEYDIHFTNNDPEKIASYLTLIDNLQLPQEGSPYLAFAGQLIKNNALAALVSLLKTVDSQIQQLKGIPVPAVLADLHRQYLGIWETLDSIFNDLKQAQQNPVLIYLDQKKGEWLLDQISEAERLKATTIAQLKLAPFEQHAQ